MRLTPVITPLWLLSSDITAHRHGTDSVARLTRCAVQQSDPVSFLVQVPRQTVGVEGAAVFRHPDLVGVEHAVVNLMLQS